MRRYALAIQVTVPSDVGQVCNLSSGTLRRSRQVKNLSYRGVCQSAQSLLILLLGATAASTSQAQIPSASDAPQPLSPHESASKIQLPDGFRIELVASEPLIQDPSCIAFDEYGRLFVCELHGYNVEGHLDVTELNKSGKLDTKVRRLRWELMGGKIAKRAEELQFGVLKMLTDRDGDGIMDDGEVWADDLPPCYGVVAARGGVIVVCAPDIVYLADRDHDGKVDFRETLFTGFDHTVMERGINNPMWGLDNWIYVGAGRHAGTIRGPHLSKPVELGNQDFRIRSDGSAIEPVSGNVGTFGLAMNDIGDRFPCSGGQPAIYALPLPHRYLIRNPHVATPKNNYAAANYAQGFRISKPHPWRVKRAQDPAWIKFYGERENDSSYFSGGCSGLIYRADQFPQEYRGSFYYCEPSLNIVHRCVLTRDGAGYVARRATGEEQSEFLASTDQWFRPMNLRVGPDGALYIVDMYREIVEDYSAIPRFLQQQYGLIKGSEQGRIWRLLATTSQPRQIAEQQWPARLSAHQLALAASDPNPWWRHTAQRLLVETGDRSASKTLELQVREGQTAAARIHALYALDGIGTLSARGIQAALSDADYGVRTHALRVAAQWLDADATLLSKVITMTDDPDPRVRLEVAMALGETDHPRATEALARLAERYAHERWMQAALLSSATRAAGDLLVTILEQTQISSGAKELLRPLAATVAGQRNQSQFERALKASTEAADALTVAVLAGLNDGLMRGAQQIVIPDAVLESLTELLRTRAPETRAQAARLAAQLQLGDHPDVRAVFEVARVAALDQTQPVERRRTAMELLAYTQFEIVEATALQLLDAHHPPELQQAAIAALGTTDDTRIGTALLSRWANLTPKTRMAIVQVLFDREDRLPALLDALRDGIVGRGDLSAMQREQLIRSRDTATANLARQILQDTASNNELQQRIDRYHQALAGTRDITKGEQVYARSCLGCHKLRNQGFDVGPPLGSVIRKPDEAILLDLLDPSGHIESEYASYLVLTNDGRSFTGILASESATSMTLLKEKGVSEIILRREIDVIKASELSLMPANLHEQIGPEDAANLIAFLRHEFGP